ncbi:MAG: hypothetical protein R6W31_06010 [Bacteroidales bacterium]
MLRLVISTGLFLMAVTGAGAQETMDFNQLNRETYRLYVDQQWDSVIILGNIALKQDMDFFYLRMRMGIARYNQEKYRQASDHFRKALEFNEADPIALEYHYFALLFSGQTELAGIVRGKFKGDLALRLPPVGGKVIDRTGGEYLFCKALNDELLSDPDQLFSGLPPGVQYVTRHYSNVSLSLSNRIVPGIRLNHMLTYLSKSNFQYYNDGLYLLHMDPQHVNQYQYYISPTFTTQTGFTFMPVIHLLSIHYQAPVIFSPGFQGGNPQVAWEYLDKLEFASGLDIIKTAGTVDLRLGAWYANLNNNLQVQNRLGLTWYPLGNLNLYVGGFINSQYEISDSTGIIRWIPELHAGVAIAQKVWLDFNGAFGEMTNYLEQNGSIVFNSFSEIIQKKAGLTVSIPVDKKGSLIYLGGRWTAHQSHFYPFYPASGEVANSIKYNALSIYGGVSWKF